VGLEILSLQELHHEVRHAVMDADVRDVDDVGVLDRGGGPALEQEPLARGSAQYQRVIHDLERDRLVEQ
jgi:hypothetical protein